MISKKEMAIKYNVSGQTLNTYLNNGQLFELLQEAGYRKHAKLLTPKQVKIIYGFLVHPE